MAINKVIYGTSVLMDLTGDTVTAATKKARLETGLEVQVPLFIEQDTLLLIDTREGRYLKRA